jgi:amidohydrolase
MNSFGEDIGGYVVKWRREFHRNPELSFSEVRTSGLVSAELARLGYSVRRRVGGHGVVGLLKGRPGRTVALRADMDALPINEENRIACRSRHPGRMHACGHDGHMAMLLGAARLLAGKKKELPGSVKLIFQPAEETPPGGALGMIRAGALKNPGVDAIFALHLDSSLPSGKVGLRRGPMMAASDNFEITLQGRGGHAARPHSCLDPVPAAAQIISGLQTIVSRRVDPVRPAVITVGRIEAGSKHNIIPERALLAGTARSIDRHTTRMLPLWMGQLVRGIARANGLRASLRYERGYPVLYNDAKMVDLCRRIISGRWGRRAVVDLEEPMMGGEDMAYFLQQVPGAFLRLGSRSGPATAHPWHHPRFDIDEGVLQFGAGLLAALAEEAVLI